MRSSATFWSWPASRSALSRGLGIRDHASIRGDSRRDPDVTLPAIMELIRADQEGRPADLRRSSVIL